MGRHFLESLGCCLFGSVGIDAIQTSKHKHECRLYSRAACAAARIQASSNCLLAVGGVKGRRHPVRRRAAGKLTLQLQLPSSTTHSSCCLQRCTHVDAGFAVALLHPCYVPCTIMSARA
mmetsp:Transcript_14777/g.43389  ORF Transcript_14777/g.43389 Transcript_14777/m.43389 type:complete len:119 (-) Transcript_14777:736-1092(-)